MESHKYAIVDIETTGHSHIAGDRIIQIAIVIMQDWQIQKTYTKFIHPGKAIPAFIQDLTNITDEDVKDAPPFEAYADYIYELLSDCIFVAHNADFDLPFLQAEFRRVGLPKWHGKKMDTVELAKILFPQSLSYKLGDLAADFGIELEQAHRADDDAYATALLLKFCWEELIKLPLVTLELLHKRSFRLKSNLAQLFFDALYEKRRNSEKIGQWQFYKKIALLKPNQVDTAYIDSIYPSERQQKIDLMQRAMPHYEERPQQFEMMDFVWEGLQNKQETVIEASTGIGKTIGYLMPAYFYAKETGKQVVISTYTSSLMDQLLYEEIGKLEAITTERVNVALVKGMQNYVDVERFSQYLMTLDDSYDETLATLQVLIWLAKTKSGDLSELNVSGGGQLFLDKIRKTVDSGRAGAEIDFYQLAINQVKKAQLIVTNHAMVFADATRLQPIFQNVGGWIFDEAHQVVQTAISKNEKVFSYTSWKYLFGKIGTFDDGQLFNRIQKVGLKKHLVSSALIRKSERQFIELQRVFDDSIAEILVSIEQKLANTNKYSTKISVIMEELQLQPIKFVYLSNVLQVWINLAEEIAFGFKQSVEQLVSEHLAIYNEWLYFIREFKLKISEWDDVFLLKNAAVSSWLEMDRRSVPGSIQIYKKPIQVTQTIQETIRPFAENAAIIWTSGTLTVPGNRHFISDQLGIDRSVQIHELQAPQEYYSGAEVFVVTDMPDIQSVSQMNYIEAVAHAIIRTVKTTQGRCFVLFTSQDMLKKTVELIQESELLSDYLLFAQGVTSGSRMKLLKSFQKFSHSVLFGTNSFWEGVDVPGDGLSAVIVVRLPFSSPDDPTFMTRAQLLTNAGQNPFQKLALPEAILRLKQGFGRLIRSNQDRGIFIILDRRIDTKSYGQQFIESLPAISVQKLPLEHMVTQLEHWYNKKR